MEWIELVKIKNPFLNSLKIKFNKFKKNLNLSTLLPKHFSYNILLKNNLVQRKFFFVYVQINKNLFSKNYSLENLILILHQLKIWKKNVCSIGMKI
jgi:hypothetical protein